MDQNDKQVFHNNGNGGDRYEYSYCKVDKIRRETDFNGILLLYSNRFNVDIHAKDISSVLIVSMILTDGKDFEKSK